ncbi:Mitochondrial import inner membrane translocase subunit Tim10 [Frankliniella fusca]|uniref:Mitochondrial import inner membrane translocase subunit n=1 Tax=Frankliniella fusca TaxID=407009 RepID=A0AAE1HQD5_9NEOP|nr:Mitochondrial import inner membrane translocase subunit Tim10 [Frankliniella fusca]
MAQLPQLDMQKMQMVQELEIEMMSDMYNRMTQSCHKKCIPPKYKDAELGKGESVCLDRCIAKYLDIHERIGKRLTQLSMQDEDFVKRMQGAPVWEGSLKLVVINGREDFLSVKMFVCGTS